MIRLALYGPQGAGKSTSSSILQRRLGAKMTILHSAWPLYDLQNRLYSYARIEKDPVLQDSEMLRTLAAQVRRLRPSALADLVVDAAAEASALGEVAVFVCDDSVPADREVLVAGGFKFVHIDAPEDIRLARRRARGDVGEISAGWTPAVLGDLCINNSGSIEELETALSVLVREVT